MKKVLSFVLVLAMILGCTSMAFAYTEPKTVTADNTAVPFEDAETNAMMTILRDLGILGGTGTGKVELDKTIDRASFCKILMVALGLEAECVKQETKFADVPADHWASGYVAVANRKGYVDGKSATTFDPAGKVTGYEAIAFVVKALGYDQAHLEGTWPENYLNIAVEIGLLTKNNFGGAKLKATAGEVTREYAFTLLFNALDKHQVAWRKSTKTIAGVPVQVEGWTVLEQAYNPDVENGGLTLLSSVVAEDNGITVGAIYRMTAASVLETGEDLNGFDYSAYAGQNIAQLEKKTKAGWKAIGLGAAKSETIADAKILDAAGTITTIGGVALATSTNLAGLNAKYVVNGGVTTNAIGLTSKTAVTVEADLNDDGKIATVYSIAYEHMDAKLQVSSKGAAQFDKLASTVAVVAGQEFAFAYDTTEKAIKAGSYVLEGVDKLEDIDEDAIVEIYLNAATGKIAKLIVTKNEIDSKLTSQTKRNGVETLKVNGVDYKVAKTTAAALYTDGGKEYNGTSVFAFFLDKNGEIAASRLFTEKEGEAIKPTLRAFVLDVYVKGDKVDGKAWEDDATAAPTSSYAIKLVDFAGTEAKTFNLTTKAALIDGAGAWTVHSGSAIAYGLDADGNLVTMKAVDYTGTPANYTPSALGFNGTDGRYAENVKFVQKGVSGKFPTQAAFYKPLNNADLAGKAFAAGDLLYTTNKAGYIDYVIVSGAGVTGGNTTTKTAIALVAATLNKVDKTTFATIIWKGVEEEVAAKDYLKASVAGIYTAVFEGETLATITDLAAGVNATTTKGVTFDGFGHIKFTTDAAVAASLGSTAQEVAVSNTLYILCTDGKDINIYKGTLEEALAAGTEFKLYKTSSTGYYDTVLVTIK